MSELIKIIVEHVSIWAPSLVAVLGVIYTVVVAAGKTKDAFEQLKKDETLKDLRAELKSSIKQNAELNEKYNLLLDELTKIKDYVKHKKEK